VLQGATAVMKFDAIHGHNLSALYQFDRQLCVKLRELLGIFHVAEVASVVSCAERSKGRLM
jgi:hypothetical protein